LGRTGALTGDDVLQTITANPQSAKFITHKLWAFFAGEHSTNELDEALAATFRAGGNNFRPFLRTLFLSEEFYSPEIIRQQVKSPVQWLVGSVRCLERDLPPAPICINALRTLGQDLLMPPNVKGWDGGLSWITTNNLLNRYNYINYLVLGENPLAPPAGKKNRMKLRKRLAHGAKVDADKLFPESLRADKTKLLAAMQKRLLQGELTEAHQSAARAFLESEGDLDDVDILQAIRLIMSTPEYQLT